MWLKQTVQEPPKALNSISAYFFLKRNKNDQLTRGLRVRVPQVKIKLVTVLWRPVQLFANLPIWKILNMTIKHRHALFICKFTSACSMFVCLFLDFISNYCFFNTTQKLINGVSWLDGRYGPSPILCDTVTLMFILISYFSKLFFRLFWFPLTIGFPIVQLLSVLFPFNSWVNEMITNLKLAWQPTRH